MFPEVKRESVVVPIASPSPVCGEPRSPAGNAVTSALNDADTDVVGVTGKGEEKEIDARAVPTPPSGAARVTEHAVGLLWDTVPGPTTFTPLLRAQNVFVTVSAATGGKSIASIRRLKFLACFMLGLATFRDLYFREGGNNDITEA